MAGTRYACRVAKGEPAWVEEVVLEGRFVRLEPLRARHAKSLAQNADPEVFRYTFGPRDQSVAALREFVTLQRSYPATVAFAIVPRESRQAVGCTTYMEIRPKDRILEIGRTWIGREWQGTAINPEGKLLLLEHAFERLGAERVQLKTDRRNLQSQHAIEKLGAIREGVLRRHMKMPDGFQRDTVMYSIVRDEWASVKERLMIRLSTTSA